MSKILKNDCCDLGNLPQFIIHQIMSKLNQKERIMLSIVCQGTFQAWCSIPIVEFTPQLLGKQEEDFEDDDLMKEYVSLIEKKMERYAEEKYLIQKFHLEFPNVNKEVSCFIDKWMKIAVSNKVEEIVFECFLSTKPKYNLPIFFLSGKTLRVVKLNSIILPFCEQIHLNSLLHLNLSQCSINEETMGRLICKTPLIDLTLRYCKVKKPINCCIITNINRILLFGGYWPFHLKDTISFQHLKSLQIFDSKIKDDGLSFIASKLPCLDSLVVIDCLRLKEIRVENKSLRELRLISCDNLIEAVILTSKLQIFEYKGIAACNEGPGISLKNDDDVMAECFICVVHGVTTEFFVHLKEFLQQSNIFNILKLDLSVCLYEVGFKLDKKKMKHNGNAPYKIQELRLFQTSCWMINGCDLATFAEGFFWVCRPDHLIIIGTTVIDKSLQVFVDWLRKKNVRMEVERLKMKIKIKLFW